MKNYITIGLLVLLPSFLIAQGGLQNHGATLTIAQDIQLKILDGGVLNQENGNIINNGVIHLTENWAQEGAHSNYRGTGVLTFVGNKDQEIASTSPMKIAKLNLNNGHHLILNSDLQITQQLDLTHNGSVELGTHNLILQTLADIRNYDAHHYIITNNTGVLQQEVATVPVHFPVGNDVYNPAILENTGTIDNFQVRVNSTASEALKFEKAMEETWFIEEEIKGGSLVNLTLQWQESQELTHFEQALAFIYPSNFTDNQVPIKQGDSWSLTTAGLSDFSSFIIANQTTTALIENESNSVQLFPNPIEDHLYIRLEGATGQAFVEVFDSKGSLTVQRQEIIENQLIHLNNLQDLVDGVYWIRITKENNKTTTHKFVKGRP